MGDTERLHRPDRSQLPSGFDAAQRRRPAPLRPLGVRQRTDEKVSIKSRRFHSNVPPIGLLSGEQKTTKTYINVHQTDKELIHSFIIYFNFFFGIIFLGRRQI